MPTGVAIDPADNLFIADTYNHRVRKLTPQGELTTVAGSGGNGKGSNQLYFPRSVALDKDGNLYIADSYNHRVQKVSASGEVTTVAGRGGIGSGSDQLQYPRGLAVDGGGNLYIADTYNHRVQKVAQNGVVTTVAGLGGVGNGANQLNFPHGLAVDGAGNLYIADMLNQRVQRVDAQGIVVTVFGTREPGDAPFQVRNPGGVAVDGSGTLYVCDTNNDRVQMVLRSGTISSVAGTGGQGPGEAQLFSPYAAAVDSRGDLFVADTNNHRIQRIPEVVLPVEPELRSVATNRPSEGAPNLLMKVTHPVECAVRPEVVVGGYRAEVTVVSGKFLRFAVPEAVDTGVDTDVWVTCRGASVFPAFRLPMSTASPALFSGLDSIALAETGDGASKLSTTVPVRAAEIVTLFVTGLGALQAADSQGLRWTRNPVTVTVGGVPAEVLYSGAAPGQSSGVQQINMRIPVLTAGAGKQEVIVTAAEKASQRGVYLPIQ